MRRPSPILIADRFPGLRRQLISLLEGLGEQDWNRPTAAPNWFVKDVAAHLLGGDIGILSRKRDGFRPKPPRPIQTYPDLVTFLNELNDTWVRACKRMSGRVLTDFLAFTGPEVETVFASLDPMQTGEPVSWAGPEPASVWLDIAREFTERWHHQQQIRDAVAAPPLYEPYFFAPVLDTFMRALPHVYRNVEAPDGTTIEIRITGDAGGYWYLHRSATEWDLNVSADGECRAGIEISQDTAWRLFTKGLKREQARERATLHGDAVLAQPFFGTVAVIG